MLNINKNITHQCPCGGLVIVFEDESRYCASCGTVSIDLIQHYQFTNNYSHMQAKAAVAGFDVNTDLSKSNMNDHVIMLAYLREYIHIDEIINNIIDNKEIHFNINIVIAKTIKNAHLFDMDKQLKERISSHLVEHTCIANSEIDFDDYFADLLERGLNEKLMELAKKENLNEFDKKQYLTILQASN